MITKTKEAITDMIKRADEQLKGLRQQINQVQQERDLAQACISQCMDQAKARTSDVEQRMRHMQELTARDEQAKTFAQLAQGTAQEREAIVSLKTLQAECSRVQKELEQFRTRAEREQAKEQEQIGLAHATLEKSEATLQDLQTKLASLTTARQQMIQERGEGLKATAMEAIRAQQARIDARRQEVVQAQLALEQLYDEQIAQLADYPELAAEIRALQGSSDATSRVIAAALSYVETLLAERHGLKDQLDLPATHWQSPWWRILAIPDDELWRYQNLRNNTSMLIGRREKLQQVLSEYRESKKS